MNEIAIIFKIYYTKNGLEFYPINVEDGNYNNKFFVTKENKYRHISYLFESNLLSNQERYCYGLRKDIDEFMDNDPETTLEEIKSLYFNSYHNCHILCPYYRLDFLHNYELIMIDSNDNPFYFRDKDINQRKIAYGRLLYNYEQNYDEIQRWIENNNDEINMIPFPKTKILTSQQDESSKGTIIKLKKD